MAKRGRIRIAAYSTEYELSKTQSDTPPVIQLRQIIINRKNDFSRKYGLIYREISIPESKNLDRKTIIL